MKALCLLCALLLTACTGINGKYIATCDKPVATPAMNAINHVNTSNVANSVYTQEGYISQGTDLSYTVKKGDTIYSIARKLGLSPTSILTKNTLINANTLNIGSAICLPAQ